jgi:uncharacterized protein YdeI (BOF family)
MSNLAKLTLACALVMGASSLAMAQAPGTMNGNASQNAGASGGAGTHAGAMKSGSQENSQKVYKNNNGYQPGKQ